MINACDQQDENELQWKKKQVHREQKIVRICDIKRVTHRKFHVVVLQNNGKEM